MPRLQVSPQNSVNQRPTMALLSSSFDTVFSFAVGCAASDTSAIRSCPDERHSSRSRALKHRRVHTVAHRAVPDMSDVAAWTWQCSGSR